MNQQHPGQDPVTAPTQLFPQVSLHQPAPGLLIPYTHCSTGNSRQSPELQLRRDRPGMPHQVKLAERPQQKLERLPATKTQESSPGKKAEPVKTRSTPRGMRLFSLIPASGIPACSAGSSRAPMRHQLFPGIRPEAPSEEDSIWGRFSQRRRSAPQCRASPSRTRWTSSRGPSS